MQHSLHSHLTAAPGRRRHPSHFLQTEWMELVRTLRVSSKVNIRTHRDESDQKELRNNPNERRCQDRSIAPFYCPSPILSTRPGRVRFCCCVYCGVFGNRALNCQVFSMWIESWNEDRPLTWWTWLLWPSNWPEGLTSGQRANLGGS